METSAAAQEAAVLTKKDKTRSPEVIIGSPNSYRAAYNFFCQEDLAKPRPHEQSSVRLGVLRRSHQLRDPYCWAKARRLLSPSTPG